MSSPSCTGVGTRIHGDASEGLTIQNPGLYPHIPFCSAVSRSGASAGWLGREVFSAKRRGRLPAPPQTLSTPLRAGAAADEVVAAPVIVPGLRKTSQAEGAIRLATAGVLLSHQVDRVVLALDGEVEILHDSLLEH